MKLTKAELKQILANKWNERRQAARIRSEKNSKAVQKWKLRELELREKVKDKMRENIKRQAHFVVLEQQPEKK